MGTRIEARSTVQLRDPDLRKIRIQCLKHGNNVGKLMVNDGKLMVNDGKLMVN